MNNFNSYKKQQVRLAKHIPNIYKLSRVQRRLDNNRKIKHTGSVLKHFLFLKNLLHSC
jgi:hypothetical protein